MEQSKSISMCTPNSVQVTHVFDIFGYSNHRGMGNEKFIRSGTFSVGGHDWSIRFYPDGYSTDKVEKDYISVYLELMSKGAKSTGMSASVHKTELRTFDPADLSRFAPQTSNFKKRGDVESAFLANDRLTIECIVTVIKDPHVTESKPFPKIEVPVPPSDIAEHIGKLLEDDEGFDVTFCVRRKTIGAHRSILAARSPVFKAELFGPMKEARTPRRVTIKDMQPGVFSALLHFIYTDSLPDGDKNTDMIQHLLVAADRYAMERLKLACQSILCENLNMDTVATTWALADQHSCDKLKDACLEYIACSNAMDAVVETQGYKNLKVADPSLIVDLLERTTKACSSSYIG
ncbi:BTB/POZ and MATH domain-containing protein 1-like [Aegilops tauschii subsp. strangulata]|uniref:Speckle-type POZ protein n=1 Tax=Aegilops tauschii TaxID=37682 RepID=M8BEB6_AEGTA|nr:BTB/POZ and MATH domain-containing protein 1-like [Triticum aestivum]